MRPFVLAALTGVFSAAKVAADCIADPDLNAEFEAIVGGHIPAADSCCQNDVCAIPCPEPVSGTYASVSRDDNSEQETDLTRENVSFQRPMLASPLLLERLLCYHLRSAFCRTSLLTERPRITLSPVILFPCGLLL